MAQGRRPSRVSFCHKRRTPTFANADLIAAGLSPFRPQAAALRAGRLLLAEIATHVANLESFAFETTLAGRGYARNIPRWQAAGYHVKIMFLGLPNADLAVARVAARVAQGGHDVPEEAIHRRFKAGLDNFQRIYRSLVNARVLYDNSGTEPKLLEWGEAA